MIFSLLLIMLLAMGWVKQPEQIEEKYTKDKFLSLRAVLAMLIVFGHTFPDNAYGIEALDKVLLLFNNMGFLCTSMFFFLSGYGVYESAKNRPDYFNHFFRKKIIKILVPYWIINVAYIIVDTIVNQQVDMIRILISFVWPLYNKAAWYAFSVLIVYLFMYLTMHCFRLHKSKLYICIGILLACYTASFYIARIGSWWYVSTFAVLLGIVFSDYKSKFAKSFYTWISTILFAILYVGMLWLGENVPYSIKIAIKMLLSIVFPFMLCMLMRSRRLDTKWLNILGNSSYEIYLVQGLFVQYLKIACNRPILYEISSIINVCLSIILGYLVSKPISLLFRRITYKK